MEPKIRPIQYNQAWCVYVDRKRAVQKGATQDIFGCTPPVRSSSSSAFFYAAGAAAAAAAAAAAVI